MDMKRKALGFTVVFFVITLFCGIWGIGVMRAAYVNEIRTVQNIAGIVLVIAGTVIINLDTGKEKP